MLRKIIFFICFVANAAFATPHWNPSVWPKDQNLPRVFVETAQVQNLKTVHNNATIDVLRIQVDWQKANETYQLTYSGIEASGTNALLQRSTKKPALGSYLGVLNDYKTGENIYYDSVGTGKEYRTLTRAMTFRFPAPNTDMRFELFAENPQTGVMEKVLSQVISVKNLSKQPANDSVVIKELLKSNQANALQVNIYAEGYLPSEEKLFWQHALKTVQTLQKNKFPGLEFMNISGVFHSSNTKLGNAQYLGFPIPETNTFLGLYYPYWGNLERWYNVVYPTRENKLRAGFASAPYDYPFILANNGEYWGIGNYMAFTAVPGANTEYFTMLVLHEFGHFFGLNEEYEGGGRTELEFAPSIKEPWSQNITFLKNANYSSLKWNAFVSPNTPLPTPTYMWQSTYPLYGAYQGGYGDSATMNGSLSYKPGMACEMDRATTFCPICRHAIEQEIQRSLGM